MISWTAALPEDRPVAGKRRVHKVKAGDEGRRSEARGDAADGLLEPAELPVQDELEEEAQPERRDGQPADSDEPDQEVGPSPARHGGDDAERDGQADVDQHRDGGQLEGRREALHEIVGDGLSGLDRAAEVAVDEVAEVARVLDGQGAVEAEVLADGADLTLVRARPRQEPRGVGRETDAA